MVIDPKLIPCDRDSTSIIIDFVKNINWGEKHENKSLDVYCNFIMFRSFILGEYDQYKECIADDDGYYTAVKLWAIESGNTVCEFVRQEKGSIKRIFYDKKNKDKSSLLFGYSSRTISVWDIRGPFTEGEKRRPVQIIKIPTGYIQEEKSDIMKRNDAHLNSIFGISIKPEKDIISDCWYDRKNRSLFIVLDDYTLYMWGFISEKLFKLNFKPRSYNGTCTATGYDHYKHIFIVTYSIGGRQAYNLYTEKYVPAWACKIQSSVETKKCFDHLIDKKRNIKIAKLDKKCVIKNNTTDKLITELKMDEDIQFISFVARENMSFIVCILPNKIHVWDVDYELNKVNYDYSN